jgi:hypothetical protein
MAHIGAVRRRLRIGNLPHCTVVAFVRGSKWPAVLNGSRPAEQESEQPTDDRGRRRHKKPDREETERLCPRSQGKGTGPDGDNANEHSEPGQQEDIEVVLASLISRHFLFSNHLLRGYFQGR